MVAAVFVQTDRASLIPMPLMGRAGNEIPCGFRHRLACLCPRTNRTDISGW